MSASKDGSESVDQFLARIASTPHGKDEAARRMDEEFLKGRQERQARRLERARSISPSKTGPSRTSPTKLSSLSIDSPSTPTADRALNPPVDFSPQSKTLARSNAVSSRTSPSRDPENASPRPLPSPTRPDSVSSSPHTATGLARSGTLSWQQRPASRDGPRQRPLSGFATVRTLPRPPVDTEEQAEPSRKDIAASLAQKDPTWFKQTQDRGLASAAFRKNQVEDTPEVSTSTTMQLPGMSRSRDLSKSPAPEDRKEHQDSHSEIDQTDVDRFKRGNTPDIAALRSSMIEKPPALRPNRQDSNTTRPLSLDPSTAEEGTSDLTRSSSVLSHTRSPSPTKGLGGFVESAMMRRSDSVSKRWSVQANTGLKRGDSVASARPLSLHSRGMSRDIPSARAATPSSPLSSSRPGSGHKPDFAVSPGIQNKSTPEQRNASPDAKGRESVDVTSPTRSERPVVRPQTPPDDAHLARSPSKTMDSRRWSPTKSTWLESALQQKAEPPKMQPMKEELPKWKVDLQRSKSQRASRDVSPDKRPQSRDASVKDTSAPVSPAIKSQPKPPSTTTKPASTSHGTFTAANANLPYKGEVPPTRELANKQKQESASVKADPVTEKPTIKPEELAKAIVNEEPKVTPEQSEDKKTPAVAEISKKAPVLKPKPQTPPKTDFRATLKSRAPGPEQNTGAEPEFKSMFGKLKRTTTQNYVAPDELKSNILSGKAALNTTGGPIKTKRVDEFKESIMSKKEEMKAAGIRSPQSADSKGEQEAPVPEGLARRKTLSKTSDTHPALVKSPAKEEPPKLAMKPVLASKTVDTRKPELGAKETLERSPSEPSGPAKATVPLKDEHSGSTTSFNPQAQPTSTPTSKSVDTTTSDRRHDVKVSSHDNLALSKPIGSLSTVKNPEASPTAEMPPASKLASRLNPNLAAMLSRGPSPRPQSSANASTDDLSLTPSAPSTKTDGNADAGSLTHMTKARAKGPKRRAPKAEPAPTTTAETTASMRPVESVVSQEAGKQKPTNNASPSTGTKAEAPTTSPAQEKPDALTPKPLRTWGSNTQKSSSPVPAPLRELAQPKRQPSKLAEDNQATKQVDEVAGIAKPKPPVASKSPELRKVSGASSIDEKLKPSPLSPTPRKPSWSPIPKQSAPGPATPKKSMTAPVLEVGKDVQTPKRSETTNAQVEKKDNKPLAAAKPTTIQGLGLKLTPSPQANKAAPKPRVLTPPPEMELSEKQSRQPQQIREVLEGYVGVLPKEHDKADFDAQQFLASANTTEDKIRTLQCTVKEITGDGKKTAMPPQQEHILYEESMYLITHRFSTEAGATISEVYLWRGDRVADASVEDAQIFCRRDAREHSAKLEVVKQGKESSKLIQALGGILIVRRSKSSALYMLCGRRHLGHIVFDEIEMEARSLCPGFTCVISAPFGKLYLWKGKGAGVDEISSAKLIGMDLGLTGEIEEVDQGSEPSAFWAALGSKSSITWSDDWAQRAKTNDYPTALYRIEHERPGMLTNLASWGLKRAASPTKQQTKATCERVLPYTQNDLDTSAVHIIDAYRTLYVLLTRQCASKASEFITALYLAQDFAMLSPAIQDRPMLPVCYVVAGEMTSDVKACFRKWSALEGNELVGEHSICVRLEEVMEALDL